jgi:hypothetical protein
MTRVCTFWLIISFQVLSQHAGAQLTLVNVGNTNIGVALDLKVSGHYAFLANGYAGMTVCDVSNPTNPISVGSIASLGYPRGIAISGEHAFLASDRGLDIYDVSNPIIPISVCKTNLGGAIRTLAISGNYASVPVSGLLGLRMVDVSNPTNPVVVGNASGGGYFDIVLSDGFAYATEPNSGHTIYVYDVHNPTMPTNVYASAGAYVFGLAVSGNYLFAASEFFVGAGSGVLTFDISNRTNPVYRATTGGSTDGRLVATNGFVYLIDSGGLVVYDASNPTNLVNVGNIKNTDTAHSVAVSGSYAYVSGSDGLHVNAIVPRLGINLVAPSTLRLSWLTPASYKVQQNNDLTSTNWDELTNTPFMFGTRAQLDIPTPTGSMFYRLVSQ